MGLIDEKIVLKGGAFLLALFVCKSAAHIAAENPLRVGTAGRA